MTDYIENAYDNAVEYLDGIPQFMSSMGVERGKKLLDGNSPGWYIPPAR